MDLNPGSTSKTIYFRTPSTENSFESLEQTLTIPDRTAIAPLYTLSYEDESTDEDVPTTVEFRVVGTDEWISGDGTPVNLIPGESEKTYEFRTKGIENSFPSEIFELTIPARPSSTSSYTINYITRQISTPITSDEEFSFDNELWENGDGVTLLDLEPGTEPKTIYIRTEAGENSFASASQIITIPALPPTPNYAINFAEEMTSVIVPSTDQYRIGENGVWTSGDGTNLQITPTAEDQIIYFRTPATSNSFMSNLQSLNIPAQDEGISVLFEDDDANTINFPKLSDYPDDDDYEITFDMDEEPIQWTPVTEVPVNVGNNEFEAGDVGIRVAATLTSFASAVTVTLTDFTSDVGLEDIEFTKYILPNPISSFVEINISKGLRVEVLNTKGKVVIPAVEFQALESKKIKFTTLSSGIYYLKIYFNKEVRIIKVVKE